MTSLETYFAALTDPANDCVDDGTAFVRTALPVIGQILRQAHAELERLELARLDDQARQGAYGQLIMNLVTVVREANEVDRMLKDVGRSLTRLPVLRAALPNALNAATAVDTL